ncbi:MAG: RNA polymerase sigma factor [Bacilli bacterium]|jgi:RNA polymerase sigma-70 factor (ECF subfamily)
MASELERAMVGLQNGDVHQLEIVYKLTSKGVFTFVLPIVKAYDIAEDVMQSTYVRAYENIASYTLGTNPRNWLLTIAKNLALGEVKKRNREPNYDFSDENVSTEGVYDLNPNLDTPTIDLANRVLNESEMNIVLLYAIGGYKHREIAEILNLPLGTVTSKYNAALKKIRIAYERENEKK